MGEIRILKRQESHNLLQGEENSLSYNKQEPPITKNLILATMKTKDSNNPAFTLIRRFKPNHPGYPQNLKPVQVALYFACLVIANSQMWANVFDLHTLEAMKISGIKDKHTFVKALGELEEAGLIKIISKSKNQNVPYKIEMLLPKSTPSAMGKNHIPEDLGVHSPCENTSQRNGKFNTADRNTSHSGLSESPNCSARKGQVIYNNTSKDNKIENRILIQAVINAFLEVFPNYQIIYQTKEEKAASSLIGIERRQAPHISDEDLLKSMKRLFLRCSNIKVDYYREKISLQYLVDNYNVITNVLSDPYGKRNDGVIDIEYINNERNRFK